MRRVSPRATFWARAGAASTPPGPPARPGSRARRGRWRRRRATVRVFRMFALRSLLCKGRVSIAGPLLGSPDPLAVARPALQVAKPTVQVEQCVLHQCCQITIPRPPPAHHHWQVTRGREGLRGAQGRTVGARWPLVLWTAPPPVRAGGASPTSARPLQTRDGTARLRTPCPGAGPRRPRGAEHTATTWALRGLEQKSRAAPSAARAQTRTWAPRLRTTTRPLGCPLLGPFAGCVSSGRLGNCW